MNRCDRAIYSEAIRKWGTDAQVKMFFEECGEALTAIAKHGRNHNGSTKMNIAEELADLQIMLDQMLIVFNVEDDYEVAFNLKLQRLGERLGMARQ